MTISGTEGSTIVDNDVALSIPPGAAGAGALTVALQPLAGLPAEESFAERALGAEAVPLPSGMSPSGTVFRASVADQAGVPVSAFAGPVTLAIKYGPSDLALVAGDPARLAAAYLVQTDTPAIVNPDHFPVGSWLLFPPTAVQVDQANSLLRIQAQALGGAVALLAKPASYVRVISPSAVLFSGYDPTTSRAFGTRPMLTTLRLVEPEVGSRILVLDEATGSYAYVNAADVDRVPL